MSTIQPADYDDARRTGRPPSVKPPPHELMAERLIAQLQEGAAPWQKSLPPGDFQPVNPGTGQSYRGANCLALLAQGREDPRWMTWDQARDMGGMVRHGSKGTPIGCFKDRESIIAKDGSGRPVRDASGRITRKTVEINPPIYATAYVFNAAQVDGLPPLETRREGAPAQSPLEEDGRGLPAASAREELVSEITALMVCAATGAAFEPRPANAAHVAEWIQMLQKDPAEILRVAGQAQKAADHIQRMNMKADPREELIQSIVAEATGHRPGERREPEDAATEALRAEARAFLRASAQRNEAGLPFGGLTTAQRDEIRSEFGARGVQLEEPEIERVAALIFEAAMEKMVNERVGHALKQPEEVYRIHPQPALEPRPPTPPVAQRTYLAVAYDNRQEARQLGAMWDPKAGPNNKGLWYAPGDEKSVAAGPLAKWLPRVTRKLEAAVPGESPLLSPQEEFARAMEGIGLVITPPHPILDGKSHRVPVEGKGAHNESGWYVGHEDGRPNGQAKNWVTDEEIKWKAQGFVISTGDRAAAAAQMEQRRADREREAAEEHQASLQKISYMMSQCDTSYPATPYLQRKQVAPGADTGVIRGTQTMLVPGRNIDGELQTCQYVNEDGTKRFATGARAEGSFHVVGGFENLEKCKFVVIGEGYATMATVGEALGEKVAAVSAFQAGNLQAVAEAIAARWPEKTLLIAGDDDRNPKAKETGQRHAREAAEAVKCAVVFPVFAPGEQEGDTKFNQFTDFNDLKTKSKLGMEGARTQLRAGMSQAVRIRQARAAPAVDDVAGERKEPPKAVRIETETTPAHVMRLGKGA